MLLAGPEPLGPASFVRGFMTAVIIRPLRAADEVNGRRLWTGYLDDDETTVP